MSSFGVQQPHTFRQSRPHSRGLHYLLFLPAAYAVHPQRWPLMLFLHASASLYYLAIPTSFRGREDLRASALPTSDKAHYVNRREIVCQSWSESWFVG